MVVELIRKIGVGRVERTVIAAGLRFARWVWHPTKMVWHERRAKRRW
jgi:hypothetical protein